MANRHRMAVTALVAAIAATGAGFTAWKEHEGFTEAPVIPTEGDRPTIGHGSTFYENGDPVKMTDPPITRERAEQLAINLMKKDGQRLVKALGPDVLLHEKEFEVYMDFIGQYGVGNFNLSPRRELLAGNYVGACKALLKFRFAAGYDCSTRINGRPNKRCWGVWTRQLQRHDKCMAAQ